MLASVAPVLFNVYGVYGVHYMLLSHKISLPPPTHPYYRVNFSNHFKNVKKIAKSSKSYELGQILEHILVDVK
jgi:hypothetical protein